MKASHLLLLTAPMCALLACGPQDPTPTSADAGTDAGTADCPDTRTSLGGELNESRTLYRACSPYSITGDLRVYGAGVEVAIEPGTEIVVEASTVLKFDEGARLLARGTAEAPIVFTASSGHWGGIGLVGGGSAPVVSELRHVVLRNAGDDGTGEWVTGYERAALWIAGQSAAAASEAVLENVSIEDPLTVGLHVYRDHSRLAKGSGGIRVLRAGSWPAIFDAQNLTSLPERQSFESKVAEKNRILVFNGNEGTVTGEHTWAPQNVPLELGASADVGTGSVAGKLTILAPNTLLLRENTSLRFNGGSLHAKGSAAAPLTFDWATSGKHWGGLTFTATKTNAVAHGSVLDTLNLLHGGHGNSPVVQVIGPGGTGNAGDCSAGPTVRGCTFSGRAPSVDGAAVYCLEARDHSNAYEAENSFAGCAPKVECD